MDCRREPDALGESRQMRVERLSELETVIERGIKTFYEVGHALTVIREQRYYRDIGYHSFEDYCREKWHWGRDRAEQLIQAARVVSVIRAEEALAGNVTTGVSIEKLPTAGRHLPMNERQTRELARIKNDDVLCETWNHAAKEHGANVPGPVLHQEVNKALATTEARAEQRQVERLNTALFGGEESVERQRGRLNEEIRAAIRQLARTVERIDPATHVPVLTGETRGELRRQIRETRAWLSALDHELQRQLPLA